MAMSIRSYDRARDADPKTIRRKVREGVIRRDGAGRINPAQADAAWASTRRASRMGQHQTDEAGVHAATAKIAVAAAKLRLLTARYEAMRERYFERGEAIRPRRDMPRCSRRRTTSGPRS